MDRKTDMKMMRANGYKLREIAEKYNITRERVRQIIGNTGRTKNRNREFARQKTGMTNGELSAELGLAMATIATYRGDIRHAVENGSPLYLGCVAENLVSDEMKRRGIKHKLMPTSHPFDILVNNDIKIDVKSCWSCNVPPSLTGKLKGQYNKFSLRNIANKNLDFVILVIPKDKEFFIIPYDILSGRTQIVMTYPIIRSKTGKFQKYHNRWDLLIDTNPNLWV